MATSQPSGTPTVTLPTVIAAKGWLAMLVKTDVVTELKIKYEFQVALLRNYLKCKEH